MSRRQRTSLSLVLGLLVALGWWLLQSEAGNQPLPADRDLATPPSSQPEAGALPTVQASPDREPVQAREASAVREPEAPLSLHLDIETVAALSDSIPAHAGDGFLPGADVVEGDLEATFHLYVGGRPARGGDVRFLSGPSGPRVFRASADGVAAASRLILGKHLILVRVEDKQPFHRLIKLRSRNRNHFRFALEDVGHVAGVVHDQLGRPVPGARIWIDGLETATDASGSYGLTGVPAGEGIPLRVRGEGFVPQERGVDIAPHGNLAFNFQVFPAARVRGRVLLPPNLVPVPRLYVLPGTGSRSSSELAFPFHLEGVYADVPVAADGSFELEGLPVGTALSLLAVHPRFPMTKPVPFYARQPGQQRRTLVLEPLADGLLTGSVKDEAGKPIVGAQLRVRPVRSLERSWLELRILLDQLAINLHSLDQHVIPGAMLRLDGTSAVSDQEGGFALGRPQAADGLELLVSADGFQAVTRPLPRFARLEEHVVLPALAAADADVETGSPAALRFLFLGRRVDQLRVQMTVDGAQQRVFTWDPGQPLTQSLGSPRQVLLSAEIWRGGERLSSSCRELTVSGEVSVTVKL